MSCSGISLPRDRRIKDKLAQESCIWEDEIRGDIDFGRNVGAEFGSSASVLNLVETCAPSDSTVLLLGETARERN